MIEGDGEVGASAAIGRATCITERQATVHALFVRHQSMSTVARMMGVSQITVRETLVQYQRNVLRDQGVKPPPLKAMLKGRVFSRFGFDRAEVGGRPAIHPQIETRFGLAQRHETHDGGAAGRRSISVPLSGVRSVIVTTAEAGGQIHLGFWRNLRAYAAWSGAELAVLDDGRGDWSAEAELAGHLLSVPLDADGQVEIASDVRIPARANRPLTSLTGRNDAVWTIFAHPVIQLETMPRMRVDGLRVQMTTGAVTTPATHVDRAGRPELGAVIMELAADGVAHCRHILAPLGGDGSFQDLTVRVADGRVTRGCRVEALTFGDVHHAHIDADVALATWGIGAGADGGQSLIDRLRPYRQVFHDVCDFSARSPFDARNHHVRFAQMATGDGDVRKELVRVTGFLSAARRPWCAGVLVASNHDEWFGRWLLETDFREDPANALFFLECSLDLHRRLAKGEGVEGFFEVTLRRLAEGDLDWIRFLRDGEGFKIAGVEAAIHGHKGPDGRPGGMQTMERLGLRATIGHTHRPTTRGGICGVGVCQTELAYARGPLTSWAVGHVVTYATGARQHLLFHGGRFHA